MCGIAGLFGQDWTPAQLDRMVRAQAHRGPDGRGTYCSPSRLAGLGHTRLSVIDLSERGSQPMSDPSGCFRIVLNGEIYNYLELREELSTRYTFTTRTDTEVLLAAYIEWGADCLHRLLGMFAFAIWDETGHQLFAARDRFGVKPLYFTRRPAGGLWLGSEIKALAAAGAERQPDEIAWATYFASGNYDYGYRTFWKGIERLPGGCSLRWSPWKGLAIQTWYDPAAIALEQGREERPWTEVADALGELLRDSIRLRFRADVAVGVCLSGGLDSSLLLALSREIPGASPLQAYTFLCGDPKYDEKPWVEAMLEHDRDSSNFALLTPSEAPDLAAAMTRAQDEPFGGLPTLGMGKVHQLAREHGVTVLLDGNGLDEAWAGYDYYRSADQLDPSVGPVQGSASPTTRPDCLEQDFARLAERFVPSNPFGNPVLDLQYRDLCWLKIPRALRFADRASMLYSRELRDPFLDHRIVELGLRQPPENRIREGSGKWLVRQLARGFLPEPVLEAPKRPVQTPQREWLRGPLKTWVRDHLASDSFSHRGWMDMKSAHLAVDRFFQGEGDNSFFLWQWLSLELWSRHCCRWDRPPACFDEPEGQEDGEGASTWPSEPVC